MIATEVAEVWAREGLVMVVWAVLEITGREEGEVGAALSAVGTVAGDADVGALKGGGES